MRRHAVLVEVVDLDLDALGDDRRDKFGELLGRVTEDLVVEHFVHYESGVLEVALAFEDYERVRAPHVRLRGRT